MLKRFCTIEEQGKLTREDLKKHPDLVVKWAISQYTSKNNSYNNLAYIYYVIISKTFDRS